MAKNNFIPLVGGGTQMPASAEAVAADILRLDGAVSDLAEDVGTIENWDAGDIPYDSSENYNDGTVGGSLNGLKSAIEQGEMGVSDALKIALLQLASKVAYIDNQGQTYYQALYDALYPDASLVSISAVYTQSGTVYDTDSLDSLKANLVVTATYEDSSTAVVSSYLLSGTLATGTSVITVSYGGKTATFSVTVTHDDSADWDYIWKYTDGLPPVSDWTWATQSGSGQVHEIISDGMLMTAKSGTTGRYYMQYAPTEIASAGGCIIECSLYIPTSLLNTKNWYFDVTATDGTNQLIVKFIHEQGGTDKIALAPSGAGTYTGTILDGFSADTVITIRMEVDCSTHLADVYVNGVLKASDVDLTTFPADTEVRMRVTGWGNVSSNGAGAVVQSFKIKYGLS